MISAALLSDGTVLLAIFALYAAAAAYDVTLRVIPDSISMAIVAVAVGRHLYGGQMMELAVAVGASSLCFLALSLLCAARLIGGGDVKLISASVVMVGAINSFHFLYTTLLAGGVLSLGYLAAGCIARARYRRTRPGTFRPAPVDPLRLRLMWRAECRRVRRGGPLPYGVAIAFGAIVTLGFQSM
ncbi:A24 family peptidase [Azospirillum sp.]|uniref:A24 family peptidase n=1 Tax=Azospirillum sp. TaxID=34012 RepID=UPI003D754A21